MFIFADLKDFVVPLDHLLLEFQVRTPYIPEAVVKKKFSGSNNRSEEKFSKIRKLERQIELEMQDEYILDLKSKFLIGRIYC